jgi:hypothetical protein
MRGLLIAAPQTTLSLSNPEPLQTLDIVKRIAPMAAVRAPGVRHSTDSLSEP